MTALLGNDLVVNEDSCNLTCAYCLTGQSNLKQSHRDQLIQKPPKEDRYGADSALGRQLDAICDRLGGQLRYPFLKVTGGEIFLVKGIMDFFERAARRHDVVVVQTNGVPVRDEHLARFREWGNVVLQVSLDSHRYDGNAYRARNAAFHDMMLEKTRGIIESGVPTEIYAVMHDRSIGDLAGFADWLGSLSHPAVLLPFPIRGPSRDAYWPPAGDSLAAVDQVLAAWERLRAVLPPRVYLEAMARFIATGRRDFRCHLPRLVMSSFSDGGITPCPNIWFNILGNVLEDDWQAVAAKVGQAAIYQALLAPRPRLDACKTCFTPWDLLSFYFEDLISLDQLCVSPTYAPPAIRALLQAEKASARATA